MTRIGEAGRALFPTFSVPPRPRNRVLSYPVNLMSITQLLPENYGFVFAGLFSTILANFSLTGIVIKARKKYGIKYPTLYATAQDIDEKGGKCKNQADVDAYNSAQRCHQQTSENIATIQLCGALNGLLFPRFAGACLMLYSVGRFLYGRGYASKGPEGRRLGGGISHLGDIPLYLCCAYSAAVLAGYISY